MDNNPESEQVAYDAEYHTDLSVGEILRRARLHYGLSLPDVERSLRIRAAQLASIEAGDMSGLPGRVYAIGFVRSYSEFLGLDGGKMVTLFKRQYVGTRQRPELHFPVPASESKWPDFRVIAGAVTGLALLVALVVTVSTPSVKNEIPAVPVDMVKIVQELELASVAKAESISESVPESMPESMEELIAESVSAIEPSVGNASDDVGEIEQGIVIRAVDNAWMEIRNADGKAIFSQILKTGESYIVPDEQGLLLDTGNAGGLQITVNGQVTEPIGVMGKIRRNVALEAGSFTVAIQQSLENN